MYTGPRITREEFLNSHFLKITVTELEKNYLHHNRFVLQVVTDRNKQTVKKKFSEIMRFSEEIHQKMGLKDLAIESHMRNSKKLQQVQLLFKKVNTVYLTSGNTGPQGQTRNQVRNYLYNLLFSNIQQLPSSEQEQTGISTTNVTNITMISPMKEKMEERFEDKIKEKQRQKEKNKEKQSTKLNVIKSIFKSKRDSQDFRKRDTMLKGIKSIWLKEQKGWNQKLFSVTDDSLIMIQKIEPQQKHIVFLKFLQASFEEQEYYRIKISHPLLSKAMQIRLSPLETRTKDERQDYFNLLYILKEVCDKGQRSAYNFVGVYLSNKKNKFMVEPQKRPAQRLSVKLVHQDQIYSFTIPIDSGVYLQLPILSNYGKYQAEIVQQKQTGIITLSSQKSIDFVLPVQSIYDQLLNDKPKRKTPDVRSHILESKQCNYSIRLQYFSLTSWRSYCVGDSTDRFEGVVPPTEFSREEFRIQRNRAKRIMYSVQQWIRWLANLRNFQYPLRSVIFYVLLVMLICFFDANSILQYSLAVTCIILACLHPTSSTYLRDLISYLSSSQRLKQLQIALFERWMSQPRFKVALKKGEEKRKFLEEFNMRTKKKRNILQKYNRLQQVLLRGQLILTQFVTLCQKGKNLFCWYHHRKTKWLFLVLFCLFFALFFVSLRFIALVAVIRMCLKGKQYYPKVRQLNQVIVYSILRIIVEEEGIASMKEHLEQPQKILDKRTSDYGTFQKKSKEKLSQILKIEFDPVIFTYGRSMKEIVEWLSECRDRFLIPEQTCRKYHFNLEWSVHTSTLTRALMAVYQLLLSVPSDRNILEVKQEKEQEPQESDDQDLS